MVKKIFPATKPPYKKTPATLHGRNLTSFCRETHLSPDSDSSR